MSTHAVIEQFVTEFGGLTLETGAYIVHDAIAAEVGEAPTAIVALGKKAQPALMTWADDRVTFYVLRKSEKLPLVTISEIPRPTGALVSVTRQPAQISATKPVTFQVHAIQAEHDSIPSGRLLCDVSGLPTESADALAEMFASWK